MMLAFDDVTAYRYLKGFIFASYGEMGREA